jgi:glycolate oxidase iron-sulfur subunit
VPYGHLIEGTREALADSGDMTPRWQRIALKPLAHPRLLRAGTAAMALAQRAHLVPDRVGLTTQLPFRQRPLAASGEDVSLFTGCVMDAWQRDVHQAGQHVLEAAGIGVAPTGDAAPCCGALQLHAGLTAETRKLAHQVIRSIPPDRPVLVDSAGCGAAMKDYGRLLGTSAALAFAERVYDIQEWLAPRMRSLPDVRPLDIRVAIQDPCHLRHVQRVHEATRTVLRPFVREIVELDDEGLCCGAGGAYSQLEPVLAADIRTRKLASIDRVKPDVVVSANPGCAMHLAAGHVQTAHPMELVWQALSRAPDVRQA